MLWVDQKCRQMTQQLSHFWNWQMTEKKKISIHKTFWIRSEF